LIAELESISGWPQKAGLKKQETIWRFMVAMDNFYMDYFQKYFPEASEGDQSHKEILKNENDEIFE